MTVKITLSSLCSIWNQVEVLKEVGTDYALADISDEEHPRYGPSKTYV